jgi:hypothetical protein
MPISSGGNWAMRYLTQAAFGVLLILAVGTQVFAEETKAHWWHFGRESDDDAPDEAAAVSSAPTTSPALPDITPVEEESWLKWPSMPKFAASETTIIDESPAATATTPPRQARSRFGKPAHVGRPRNTWAQQPASTTTSEPNSSPWKSMTERTRVAWHKTVDFVTPGDGSDPPVVPTETRQSLWDRMWGSEEPQEGPQTVTEWMAQDRLDP